MKKLIFAVIVGLFSLTATAQNPTSKTSTETKAVKKQIVEIACGECQFKMKGKDCELAIRIDGKPYFVDGKKIDDFGDAHDEHGFCNSIGKATVTGKIVKNRFQATDIKLIDAKKKSK